MTDAPPPDTFLFPRTGEPDARVVGTLVAEVDGKPGTERAKRDRYFRWHRLRVVKSEKGWYAAVSFRSNSGRDVHRDWVFAWKTTAEMAGYLGQVFNPLAGVEGTGGNVEEEKRRLAERWQAAVEKVMAAVKEWEGREAK